MGPGFRYALPWRDQTGAGLVAPRRWTSCPTVYPAAGRHREPGGRCRTQRRLSRTNFRTYLTIARACDGNDFRFRLGASEAVWPVQTRSEQQRRRRKLRPGLGVSKSGAGRGAQAANTALNRGLCVCSRTSASRTESQPPSRRVTSRTRFRCVVRLVNTTGIDCTSRLAAIVFWT